MNFLNRIKFIFTIVMFVFFISNILFAENYEKAALVGSVTEPTNNSFAFYKIVYIPGTNYFLTFRNDNKLVLIDTASTGQLNVYETNIDIPGNAVNNLKFVNGKLYINNGSINIYKPIDDRYTQYVLENSIQPYGDRSGLYGFAVNGGIIYMIDDPYLIAYYETSKGDADFIKITMGTGGGKVYYYSGYLLTQGRSGFVIFDVTDPFDEKSWDHFKQCYTLPIEITPFNDFILVGNYIYGIKSTNLLYIIDVSSPCNPIVRNKIGITTELSTLSIRYSDSKLYIFDGQNIHIYSIADDPENPVYLKSYKLTFNVYGYDEYLSSSDFYVKNDYLYSASYHGFFVFDLHNSSGTSSNNNTAITPQVTVNGQSKAELSFNDSLSVNLSLSIPEEMKNYEHFFWIKLYNDSCICLNPSFTYSLCDCNNPIPAYGGPTVSFNDLTLLYLPNLNGVPIGKYYFYYAVDSNINNHLDYNGNNVSQAEMDMIMIVY